MQFFPDPIVAIALAWALILAIRALFLLVADLERRYESLKIMALHE